MEYIDGMLPSISRDYEGPVRAIVAEKFSDMGTMVMGKLESGVVVKGQNILIMPNKVIFRVFIYFFRKKFKFFVGCLSSHSKFL